MSKLHETLAVEGSLKKVSDKLVKESIHTFSKESLFMGAERRLEMFADDAQNSNTIERQHLTTTVDENLEYLIPHIAAHWDAVGQKNITNTVAVADIMVGGAAIAKGIPATYLLDLEVKLAELRKLYEAIPTLAPGIEWQEDPNTGKGVFRAKHPDETIKTEKTIKPVELSPATKEHPAQVDKVNETIPVGKYTTIRWSGMLTPAEKAARMDRIDQLANAVKRARQRANNVDVVDFHIGETMMGFINTGSF